MSKPVAGLGKKTMITKKEVLENIDKVKEYINEIETKKEEKVIGIAIKNRWTGNIIFQSTKTTFKDAIIEKGDANLRGAYLRGADLQGANLRGADLQGADLQGADLRGADLQGADLRDAYLQGAYLQGAYLQGADLRDANLRGANLQGAYLQGADLQGADLQGANLRGAELNCAKFYGRGGQMKLKKSQLTDFLNALGFQVED